MGKAARELERTSKREFNLCLRMQVSRGAGAVIAEGLKGRRAALKQEEENI